MIRVKGRYRNQGFEIDEPLALAEGAEVELAINPTGNEHDQTSDWHQLGMSRLEDEWDNPQDAIYDNWKKLYGIQPR